MPLDVVTTAGGTNYTNPFVHGPRDVTHLKLDTSTLTTDEVDASGYLKPGVVLDMDGARVGGETPAGTATPAAAAGNVGNGVFTIDGTTPLLTGAQEGVYRVVMVEAVADGGRFVVMDPYGVMVGQGAVGSTFASQIKFAIADGATDFKAGDSFTVTVAFTAGGDANAFAYGVTFEAIKLPGRTDNASLSSDTTDPLIAVATAGLINRDIAEDNLGRAYSAAELAALNNGRSGFKLTTT